MAGTPPAVIWPPGQSVISVKQTVRAVLASAAVIAAARLAVEPPATTISQGTIRGEGGELAVRLVTELDKSNIMTKHAAMAAVGRN